MHPYDNIQRRYRHADARQETGLRLVQEILYLEAPPAPQGLYYDLSLFSGGIGVLDRLAISIPAKAAIWQHFADKLMVPEKAQENESWYQDFIWLLTADTRQIVDVRLAAVQFINRERKDFQTACFPTNRILFESLSDVNDWTAVWGDDTRLNYLGYSQG